MNVSYRSKASWCHNAHRWASFFMLSALIAATALVYRPSLCYPFEFDDLYNIVEFFHIRHLTLKDLFFSNSRWISYWLNTAYYRLLPEAEKFAPWLYRVGNVVIHCIAGTAVWVLTRMIASRCQDALIRQAPLFFAMIVTGLFLLHPVQTQTVSYVIQGQLEGLAGAFIFCMCVFFLYAVHVKTRLGYGIALLLLYGSALFACGSKEIVIVTPLVTLLLDWFFVAHGSMSSFKERLWMHLLLACIIIPLYVYLLKPAYFIEIFAGKRELFNNVGNMLTDSRLEKITRSSFFISQFKVVLHYLFIFIWPFSMSVDYDWKLSKHLCAPDCLVPLLILVALGAYLLFRLWKARTDFIAFCLLWFFMVLAPRSSLIPSTELLADYKTYGASWGMMLLLGYGTTWSACWLAQQRWWRAGWCSLYLLAGFFLAAVGYAAYLRNTVWSSPEAFWFDVIQHAPLRARAYNNYGVALCNINRHKDSIDYFIRAIELDGWYADPYNNISVAYTVAGNYKEAVKALRRGITIRPQPEGYNNLASVLLLMGEQEEAEELLKIALQMRPHYGKALFNLGRIYLKRNQLQEAHRLFKAACMQADFDTAEAFLMYGETSLHLCLDDEAIYAYSRAAALAQLPWRALMNRIYAAERTRQRERADHWFEEAMRIYPQEPIIYLEYGEMLLKRKNSKDLNKARIIYNTLWRLTSSAILKIKVAHLALQTGHTHFAAELYKQVPSGQLTGSAEAEYVQLGNAVADQEG